MSQNPHRDIAPERVKLEQPEDGVGHEDAAAMIPNSDEWAGWQEIEPLDLGAKIPPENGKKALCAPLRKLPIESERIVALVSSDH